MRSYLKAWIIAIFLVLCAAFIVFRSVRATAEQQQPPPFSITEQRSQFPTRVNLDCAGCHGAGKTLPYIAGEKFHKDAHSAMDKSIHSKLKADGEPIATCASCHTTNGDLATALPAENPKSTINRANIAETCGKCHGDKAMMQQRGISNRLLLSYRESVHAKALARGNINAAVCTDCHTSHSIQPASIAQSSIAQANIPATCGQCHSKESTQFVESVHGLASSRGVSRSPSCTGCHGIHSIQTPFEQASSAATAAVATDSCSSCHEGVVLSREFGIAGDRVTSYKDSYHGRASKMGSSVVANCASCHGVHNILPSSDPRSMIAPGNLTQTCNQCHVGAGENFSSGKVHLTSTLLSEPMPDDTGVFGTTVVRWIYLPLIYLTIGGMLVHNLLIWRKKAAAHRLSKRTVVRLSRNQRIQHWLLLTSFIVLVITGFALQYPETWFAGFLGASENFRRILHRIAAVVMLVGGVYHVFYLAFTKEGRQWIVDMVPRWKDIVDVVQNLSYYLGLRQAKPKIARFGYVEKAEYWAVVWGTVIMGATGLLIWFKIDFFGSLPRWWVDIAIAIHFYEAVLATLAILVWHFYSVIFDPDVYPINFAFLDGRISEELLKEEHELAYEEMIASQASEASEASEASGEPASVEPPQVDREH